MYDPVKFKERVDLLVREERELDYLCKSEPDAPELQERLDRMEAIANEFEKIEDELNPLDKANYLVLEELAEEREGLSIVALTLANRSNPVEDKYRKAIKELERLFDFFNKKYTNNTLPTNVLITIQTRGRRKQSMGWFSPNQWSSEGESYSEINISAETLSHGGEFELVDTLLHEMAHLRCHQKEIKDVSKDGYHNKKFKDVAESFGLEVDKSIYYGYNMTQLSDKTKKTVEALKIDKSVFSTVRVERLPVTDEKYENLLVRKSFKPIIKDFAELTGMSMLDLIESSITKFMENYEE